MGMFDVRKAYSAALQISRDFRREGGLSPSEAAEKLRIDGRLAEALVAVLPELYVSFPSKRETWYARALTRFMAGVRRVGRRHWSVRGFPELGDAAHHYNVVLGRDERYICDCYSHKFGYYRRVSVCTHVAAVILARRMPLPLLYHMGERNGEG